MPDLTALFRSAPVTAFSGTVYRICPAGYRGNLLSMRGSFLHGARYNIRAYFGVLYTSISKEIAHREMARYFTVPPIGGFVEAAVRLRLSRVLDLTGRKLLQQASVTAEELAGPSYVMPQEIGRRAWESGIEALIVPSAADPSESNLAVFLDNQDPRWLLELTKVSAFSG
jgi:RES domain-containing protein